MARTGQLAAKAGPKLNWLHGAACGLIVAFATASAILIVGLMVPAIMAILFDRTPGRQVARAMALSGAAFTIFPLWHLWLDGETNTMAADMLMDPTILGSAWLAQGCGWGLCEILPVLLRVAAEISTRKQIETLKAEEKAIQAEWDFN
jgi:hypothetical protein